ncbi:winged helix-turn-helix domain-containing protein [Saccharopolyspora hattusasensis]|uniref:winged helix-turn-helix domain-containing protein n=1 Tax=Saccharopolyspora hattusasensis TaxID=1128679 RepID=UPI003D95447F
MPAAHAGVLAGPVPFRLPRRSAGAVAELIRVRHGVVLSLRTVGDYLRCWGVSPQTPVRRPTSGTPRPCAGGWRRTIRPSLLALAARAR